MNESLNQNQNKNGDSENVSENNDSAKLEVDEDKEVEPQVSRGSTSNNPEDNKLLFILLVILLTTIIVGGGIWCLKEKEIEDIEQNQQVENLQGEVKKNKNNNTIDEYANWKTYENEEYDYEIKYPSTLTIDTTFSEKGFSERGENNLIGGDVNWSESIFLLVYKIDEKTSIDEFVKNQKYEDSVDIEDIIIMSGQGGKRYNIISSDHPAEIKIANTFIKKDDKMYVFNLSDWDLDEVYRSMLLSFKFTNNETADWNTYKNEKYGFEIKYPEDWTFKEEFSRKGMGGPVSILPNNQSSPIIISVSKDFDKNYILEKYPDFGEEWADGVNCGVQIVTSKKIDDEFNQNFYDSCSKAYETESIKVDGVDGIKCKFATGPGHWEAIWLTKNKKGVAFNFNFLSPIGMCDEIFNKIVSNFSFL